MPVNNVPEGMSLVKAESLEALADNIAAVAAAARVMGESRLHRAAIVLLVQESAPTKIGKDKINIVIDALQRLDTAYLKPKKDKK